MDRPEVGARRKVGNSPLSIEVPYQWKLIGIRPFSSNNGDEFLSIILCESILPMSHLTNFDRYATWIYNWQILQGCCSGRYDMTLEKALKDFCERR